VGNKPRDGWRPDVRRVGFLPTDKEECLHKAVQMFGGVKLHKAKTENRRF